MRSRFASVLLALLCLFHAGPACADDQDEARRLMEEAVKADQDGDKERAAELFSDSLKLHPSYDVAGNLGLVEFRLERYAAAANHLSYCLRHFASGQKRELRELIEQKLSVAKQYVGELAITVSKSQAEIRIGEEVVGTSPLGFAVFVEPGTHEVSARLGERTVTKSETVALNSRRELRLDIPEDVSVGKYEPAEARVAPWWPAYAAGGVAVASFGVSIAARAMAQSELDEIAALRSALGASDCYGSMPAAGCDDLQRAESRYDTRATVADVSLVTGVVFAAATVGYVSYVLVKRSRRTKRAEAFFMPVPVVSDRGLGLLLEGKF